LYVSNNDSLTTVDGLSKLDQVVSNVDITWNPRLCTSDAKALTQRVDIGGRVSVSNNDDGC